MKRLVLLFSILFALLFVLPAANENFATKAEAQYCVVITGNGVRLRYGPGLDYGICCKVNKGKKLTYYSTYGDWYCVGYNGQTLYVSRDFAGLHKGSASSSSSHSSGVSSSSGYYTKAVVHAKNLRLRTGPSTSYPYLIWTATGKTVHLNYGDVLIYLGQKSNGFYKVKYNGVVCWVAAEYVSLY